MADYALQFPFFDRFDFIEHFFFIQRLPSLSSEIRKHSNVQRLSLFEHISLNQVHSGIVHCLDSKPGMDLDGDGIITSQAGLAIGVHVADCAPVYLIDPVKKAIGVIHCGWRPVAENIVENSIAKMTEEFGSSSRNIYAFIGPTIQYQDYEIGSEIIQFFDSSSVKTDEDRYYLDIPGEIKLRLIRQGLNENMMCSFPISTFTEPAFCSYRREGSVVKRMTAIIKKCR